MMRVIDKDLFATFAGASVIWLTFAVFPGTVRASDAIGFETPPSPPADALGYPSRAPDLDVLPGFQDPPAGYGQVPFWWWTGDPLNKDRLIWQIEQLHDKGVSGMQVNYAHRDAPGAPTFPADPPIFSDRWWQVWIAVAKQCAKRDMGIGMSSYTLDWPNGKSLISRTIYSDPKIQGRQLHVAMKPAAEARGLALPASTVAVRAYPVDGTLDASGVKDLSRFMEDGQLNWQPDKGHWQVWIYSAQRKPGTLNPIHPESGARVVEQFYQRFQDHAPDQSAEGLNYFFNDELHFGVGDRIWTDDLPEQFRRMKGYDLFEALPAMFQDVGDATVKYRLDFMDVKTRLAQQRYFIPVFKWHWSRGKIFGCDQASRGRNPMEFGDYFSAVRWYTAPGHDTPGGHADLIKGKVSSAIAQLYRRPRVWLEGYHSLGWGATPENLMYATRENYLYGCNLLNLHGLYYTTHGSYWEWAPPSYHFRMPYWDHMGVFFRYFERLSYLMSQGSHQCDIAVMYPVSPGQAQLGGREARSTAFAAGTTLMDSAYDFIFMDFESLARAQVCKGRLHVSDASYRVLVLPAMRAVRWSTLKKVRAFYRRGGIVIALDKLPEASDRAGRNDPLLDKAVKEIFGVTAAEARAGARPGVQRNGAGGVGLLAAADPAKGRNDVMSILTAQIAGLIERDVVGEGPIKATHRKIGLRDVYMVMGAARGSRCTFRATGRAELWDPWTGSTRPLHVVARDEKHTTVTMPLESYEAQLVAFTPGEAQPAVPRTTLAEVTGVDVAEGVVTVTGWTDQAGEQSATVTYAGGTANVRGEAAEPIPPRRVQGPWAFELKPTMNNRWGDFRLPITEKTIGPEARIFRYARQRGGTPAWQARDLNDSNWPRVTCGFGPKFWKLGPMPADVDVTEVEAHLATLDHVDPEKTVTIDGKAYHWQAYAFSWRWGVEGDPGHQGFHGLKKKISDNFIRLGKPSPGGRHHQQVSYGPEEAGTRYYLWTSVPVDEPTVTNLVAAGEMEPAAVYVNGKATEAPASGVRLERGTNPLLLRYDRPGRAHFVVKAVDAEAAGEHTPLAMRWYDDPGVLGFDLYGTAEPSVGWYRFTAPPALRSMSLTVRGRAQAWADGRRLAGQMQSDENGRRQYRFRLAKKVIGKSVVAVRIEPDRGYYGGSAIPQPVRLDCGEGVMPLGDWSKGSSLACYSGGAWYRKTIELSPEQAGRRVVLDLGDVAATAEVHVNGRKAGVRVAPPWKVDITDLVKPGDNRLEILIYNTLANHYSTIPTRYGGDTTSGLLGPVSLEFSQVVELHN